MKSHYCAITRAHAEEANSELQEKELANALFTALSEHEIAKDCT